MYYYIMGGKCYLNYRNYNHTACISKTDEEYGLENAI